MASTLAPHGYTECSSPGSSIFDLPSSNDVRSMARGNTQDRTDIGLPRRGALDVDDAGEGEVPSCLVISGGTGCNAICSAFGTSTASYILPVSDDGGSSSEIIRVIGGPSIGA